MNKGFAEDLTEGKFSFPIVHGVRADQSNRVILSAFLILRLKERNAESETQTYFKNDQQPQR